VSAESAIPTSARARERDLCGFRRVCVFRAANRRAISAFYWIYALAINEKSRRRKKTGSTRMSTGGRKWRMEKNGETLIMTLINQIRKEWPVFIY